MSKQLPVEQLELPLSHLPSPCCESSHWTRMDPKSLTHGRDIQHLLCQPQARGDSPWCVPKGTGTLRTTALASNLQQLYKIPPLKPRLRCGK